MKTFALCSPFFSDSLFPVCCCCLLLLLLLRPSMWLLSVHVCVCVYVRPIFPFIYIYINKQLFTWYNESHGALKGVCVCVCVCFGGEVLVFSIGPFSHSPTAPRLLLNLFFFFASGCAKPQPRLHKDPGLVRWFFWRAEFSSPPPNEKRKKQAWCDGVFFSSFFPSCTSHLLPPCSDEDLSRRE